MAEAKYNEQMLLDKLGERFLFEKKTVAIYDLIIRKLGRASEIDVGELRRNRDQEKEHHQILEQCIKECGSSTREKTPSMMMVELQSQAFERIVNDTQDPSMLLHVLLDAELEDNASWELLIQLSRQAKMQDYIQQFQKCDREERQHLRGIRKMVVQLARKEIKQIPEELRAE